MCPRRLCTPDVRVPNCPFVEVFPVMSSALRTDLHSSPHGQPTLTFILAGILLCGPVHPLRPQQCSDDRCAGGTWCWTQAWQGSSCQECHDAGGLAWDGDGIGFVGVLWVGGTLAWFYLLLVVRFGWRPSAMTWPPNSGVRT